MDYTLTIKGFKSMKQVEAFASWYDAQGEQGASIWFECMQSSGKLDVDFMGVDHSVEKIKTANNLTITINPTLG